jgi:hypothetical protein
MHGEQNALFIYTTQMTQQELFEELGEDIDKSILNEKIKSSTIDLFTFLRTTMMTYISQKKKQATLLRLMIETASQGELTSSPCDAKASKRIPKGDLITIPQMYYTEDSSIG